jgi:hypothetical protein
LESHPPYDPVKLPACTELTLSHTQHCGRRCTAASSNVAGMALCRGELYPCETDIRLCEELTTGQEVEVDMDNDVLTVLESGKQYNLKPLGEVRLRRPAVISVWLLLCCSGHPTKPAVAFDTARADGDVTARAAGKIARTAGQM